MQKTYIYIGNQKSRVNRRCCKNKMEDEQGEEEKRAEQEEEEEYDKWEVHKWRTRMRLVG